jgi:hypothetical protein
VKVIKETKPTPSDIFFSMFNEDSEAFESSVLTAAIVLVKKNKHFLNTICSLKPTGGYHWDFLNGARNVALISYRNYRDLMEASGTSVTGRIPSWKVMFHFCSTLLETHPDLGSVADLPKVEAEWLKLSTVTKDQVEAVKTPGVLKAWLSSVRVTKELTSAAHNGEVKRNPGALINRLTKKVADIQLEESEVVQTVFDFGEIATYDPDTAEKISSGLPQLDKAIGGGYAKSNSYCFVAYTGTGKTTFGVQMAATFCNLQGLKGIFVTTEETPMQIKLRMIAHCCNIDWGYLMTNSATFEPTSLDPKKYAMYKKMMDNMSNSFRVVDWSVAGNINQDIEEVVEQFITDKGCAPDFLIFDWLGGALDNLSTSGGSNDGDRLRHVYNSAAERLRQIGKKYRPVVIYMMQAKANALNRSRVGQDMIGESFGPSKGVSAVIGMSAVQEDGGDEAGSKNTYAERQTLFVGKSRHGPGGAVPFRRNFAVQRLEPLV